MSNHSALHLSAFSLALALAASIASADTRLPPFDFSDAYYTFNGINPSSLIGRPTGTGPNSVIDDRENGPAFNNVRLLQTSAAYDHSGHPIFFNVTGLPTAASFLSNSAGREARRIADEYDVYEFPRAANAPLAVFPKRQDLIADLRHGYFSNDPLGIWKINIVRFTAAATDIPAGRQALDRLAARNGRDLDGTPLIRTIDEIEDLRDDGYVTITVPPADGGPGVFRWFFCPVIEDPRDGVIAPDAHLDVTGLGTLPAAQEFVRLFNCLQQTGRECGSGSGGCRADCGGGGGEHVSDGRLDNNDFIVFINDFFAQAGAADCGSSGGMSGGDGRFDNNDFIVFISDFFNGTGCN